MLKDENLKATRVYKKFVQQEEAATDGPEDQITSRDLST